MLAGVRVVLKGYASVHPYFMHHNDTVDFPKGKYRQERQPRPLRPCHDSDPTSPQAAQKFFSLAQFSRPPI